MQIYMSQNCKIYDDDYDVEMVNNKIIIYFFILFKKIKTKNKKARFMKKEKKLTLKLKSD